MRIWKYAMAHTEDQVILMPLGAKILTVQMQRGMIALWAMVEIYRGILDRIELRQYDVYTERVRLSLGDKLKIFAKGFGKRLL